MLYVVMGPSGSGKTSVVNSLCKIFHYKTIESYTTRKKRSENETGHIFVTEQEFENLKNKIAPVEYDGNKYCCTKEQLENCDLVVLEPSAIDELIKNNIEFEVLYINASDEARIKRMRLRGDGNEAIESRMKEDSVVFDNIKAPVIEYFDNDSALLCCVYDIHYYIREKNNEW